MQRSRPGFVFPANWLLRPAAMDYMILKTIATSVAAASIALAAPAYAGNAQTACTSMGNGTTHARAICPQAPASHREAHATYLLPHGYSGKP
jgi:hypothetical protein